MTEVTRKKLDEVEEIAKYLFEMVNRVKGSTPPAVTASVENKSTPIAESSNAGTRDWNSLGKSKTNPNLVYEPTQEEVEANDNAILSEIPF